LTRLTIESTNWTLWTRCEGRNWHTVYVKQELCVSCQVCQRWLQLVRASPRDHRHIMTPRRDPSGVIQPAVFVLVSSAGIIEAAHLMLLYIKTYEVWYY